MPTMFTGDSEIVMEIKIDIFKRCHGYDVQSFVKIPEDFEIFAQITGVITTTGKTDEHRLEILRTVEQHFKRIVIDYEKFLQEGIK